MRNSKVIAVLLACVIGLWTAAGMILGGFARESVPDSNNAHPEDGEVVVEVREQTAERVTSYVATQGSIEPDRAATIRAEIAGRVIAIDRNEGAAVGQNDILLTLAMEDRQARLARAEARMAEARRKYESARNLGEKGFSARASTDEALSALKTAQAEVEEIRLEIENTRIRAPFNGVVDELHLELGEYVSVGDEVLTLVDNDPLVARVSVPQADIASIRTGQGAEVVLATGQTVTGTIRFVAPRAQTATRTFRVEIELANPGHVPSGISATARIPKQETLAHLVSPALLTLDDTGRMGVKTIDANGAVAFHAVDIVHAKPDGVYISGLPDKARIIPWARASLRWGRRCPSSTPASWVI